jgi:predicted HNH restriction endonuclease
MSKILYQNIVNGSFVFEPEEEYSKRIVLPEEFEREFIDELNLKINNKTKISGSVLYEIIQNGKSFDIFYQPLKNSGVKNDNKKRIHIPNLSSIYFKKNLWFISTYNTKDKILFIITKDESLLNKDSENNSSLWVIFKNIIEAYEEGISTYYNRNGRKYLILDKKNLNSTNFDSFMKNIMLKEGSNDFNENKSETNRDKENDIEFTLFDKNKHTYPLDNVNELYRNQNYKTIAIKKANFRCELCSTAETFKDREGEMYFEGHHIIPYNLNSQKNFKYLLDNPLNIACLCPNCHKKIHLSNDSEKQKLISLLMDKRPELFEKYDIKSIGDIINLYNYE